MSNFNQSRNCELSLLYYIETNVAADWSGITVLKTFNNVYAKNTDLPIIVVRLADTNSTYKEIGANTLEDRYLLIIDVFSTSDGQRLDLSYYLKNKLKDGFVYYTHSHPSGDNSTLSRTAAGRCQVTEWITDSKIDFGENGDTKDKYRHNISIRVRIGLT